MDKSEREKSLNLAAGQIALLAKTGTLEPEMIQGILNNNELVFDDVPELYKRGATLIAQEVDKKMGDLVNDPRYLLVRAKYNLKKEVRTMKFKIRVNLNKLFE